MSRPLRGIAEGTDDASATDEGPGFFQSIMNLIRSSTSDEADQARRGVDEAITRKLPRAANGIPLVDRNRRLQRQLDEVDRFGRQ